MTNPQPARTHPLLRVGVLLRKILHPAGSFLLTVFSSVALTLLVQAALPVHHPTPSVPLNDSDTASYMRWTPALVVAPEQTRQVVPATSATFMLTQTLTDTTPISQQLALLQHEVDHLWSAYYLARAASQIADAEAALRINDVSEVEQVLITVDASLDRAYDRSSEQDKGPINEFRMQIDRIHEDLRVRPEGMDQHLRRLRQSMLNLVDEGS